MRTIYVKVTICTWFKIYAYFCINIDNRNSTTHPQNGQSDVCIFEFDFVRFVRRGLFHVNPPIKPVSCISSATHGELTVMLKIRAFELVEICSRKGIEPA